jgi:hypothetical protein
VRYVRGRQLYADEAVGPRLGRVVLAYDVTGPSGTAPDVSRAAFLPGPGPGQDALGTGVLSGDPATGCLWLQQLTGAPGTPLLLYSDTARADFSTTPFRLLDGERVLAVGGTPIEVGGGGLGPGGPAGVPGCPVSGAPFAGVLLERSVVPR